MLESRRLHLTKTNMCILLVKVPSRSNTVSMMTKKVDHIDVQSGVLQRERRVKSTQEMYMIRGSVGA